MTHSQDTTPLLDALRDCSRRPDAAFYTPGHKRGQGISARLVEVMGSAVFQADLPELPELDNLFAPEGAIAQSQILAAEAFGADRSYFLVNGSTCGIEAALLATCRPGDRIILPRNVHQSAIAALILSGAVPVFVQPEYDPQWQIPLNMSVEVVAKAIAAYPDVKAILMVSPTYHGICGDVEAIAQLAHAHGIPLIVDEAHGAHFGFHPDLPRTALDCGADLAVQSIHKTLGAMTQASMLHQRGERVDGDRLRQALQLVQSTSPSYLLLASLDAARHQMAQHGHNLLSDTLRRAHTAIESLQSIPGLTVLTPPPAHRDGFIDLDCTRLTVDLSAWGITGFDADERLRQHYGVTAELPSLRQLTFIISIGTSDRDIHTLIHALQHLAVRTTPRPPSVPPALARGQDARTTSFPLSPPVGERSRTIPFSSPALSPRQAFFAATESVPLEEGGDRIAAELICPYPPGIPLIMPGDRITVETLTTLQHLHASGAVLTGCSDPTLHTLKVVRESNRVGD